MVIPLERGMKKGKPMQKIAAVAAIKIRKPLSLTASGNVPNANWNRDNQQANLNRNDSDNHNDNIGSRFSVIAYALLRDFSQPPSMRPISAKLLCAWNILVSLAIFSSKNSLSFKMEISNRLEAFIR